MIAPPVIAAVVAAIPINVIILFVLLEVISSFRHA